MRLKIEAETTVNSTVLNRITRRLLLNCHHCRPNRGENAKRRARDDRYKDHRRSHESYAREGQKHG